MGHVVIGTAGHVDHGKTTLVRALTGQDTDRLPEEKRRGISIDLGFAHFRLPSGQEASLVDVPGHERFIRNMVAGVSGIDMGLLVVAADEGMMPQTREHLDILQLLGVPTGVVALSKTDLVDPEWLDLIEDELHEGLKGTFLADAPIVRVSALTGTGLAELLAALDQRAGQARRQGDGYVRLPIDRAFTVTGFGTVVTGTLNSGTLRVEDRLTLLPDDLTVRVRGLQVHGGTVTTAQAGQRVAVNLTGVDRDQIRRGQVLATPDSLRASRLVAGELRLLAHGARPLRTNETVRLHVGTAEALGRVVLLDRDEAEPGSSVFFRFHADEPLAVARGDRFILRLASPVQTVGGGVILDAGQRYRRLDDRSLAMLRVRLEGDPERLIQDALGQEPRPLTALAQQLGLPLSELKPHLTRSTAGGNVIVFDEAQIAMSRAAYDRLRERLRAYLEAYHARHPLRRGATREEVRRQFWPGLDARASAQLLQALANAQEVVLVDETVSRPGFEPRPVGAQVAEVERLTRLFAEAGVRPPAETEALAETPRGVDGRDILRFLVERGTLVEVAEGLYFHAEAVAEARAVLEAYLREQGAAPLSALREQWGTTRKYAVPLAEYFDRQHVTRRRGDERVLA